MHADTSAHCNSPWKAKVIKSRKDTLKGAVKFI